MTLLKNTKKTIAIVTNTSWNIWNFRMDLLRHLKNEGYHILIFAPEDKDSAYFSDSGFEFKPLKWLWRGGTNPLLDLFFLVELYSKFNKYKPDLLLLYTPKPNIYGSLIARWSGIRSIATITGLGYTFNSDRLASWVIKKLYRAAHKKSDLVIFHNADDHQLFLQNNWVKIDKSKVIDGSGVNTDRFSPVKTINERKMVRFLFAGRLLYDKGISELLEAFDMVSKKYKEIELQIVGEIDHQNPSAFKKSELDFWLEKNKKIKYALTTDDVRPYIADSDVVVLPSYREGMPKTILEALAMSKPIIVSDVPGCRQTVLGGPDSNGLICKSKDSLSLANQMENMIRFGPEKREKMGKMSHKLAMIKFDARIINNEYLEEINKILG